MSGGQASEAPSAAPHHSPSLTLPPEPSLPLLALPPEQTLRPSPTLSVEKLSSTKPVPSAKKVGDRCPRGFLHLGIMFTEYSSILSLHVLPLCPQHGYSEGIWGNRYITRGPKWKEGIWVLFPSVNLPCLIVPIYVICPPMFLTCLGQSSASYTMNELTKAFQESMDESVLQRWNMDTFWNRDTGS